VRASSWDRQHPAGFVETLTGEEETARTPVDLSSVGLFKSQQDAGGPRKLSPALETPAQIVHLCSGVSAPYDNQQE
jgi:hypothetical protein